MNTSKAPDKPRYVYRFENFKRAFSLLREGIELSMVRELTPLEKEGVVQRFEYTWELAWKTLKDYLDHSGIVLETVTPAATIKAAFAANIIKNGDIWMLALDARNRMSHVYDSKIFNQLIAEITDKYLNILGDFHQFMMGQTNEK
jgi:nucleotidyltransferase substrate binding protein (TIGR01987 family)